MRTSRLRYLCVAIGDPYLCCFNYISTVIWGLRVSKHLQAEKLRETLEAELLSLGERVSELENESSLKSEEVASAAAGKQEALSSSLAEITNLREENSAKT